MPQRRQQDPRRTGQLAQYHPGGGDLRSRGRSQGPLTGDRTDRPSPGESTLRGRTRGTTTTYTTYGACWRGGGHPVGRRRTHGSGFWRGHRYAGSPSSHRGGGTHLGQERPGVASADSTPNPRTDPRQSRPSRTDPRQSRPRQTLPSFSGTSGRTAETPGERR